MDERMMNACRRLSSTLGARRLPMTEVAIGRVQTLQRQWHARRSMCVERAPLSTTTHITRDIVHKSNY